MWLVRLGLRVIELGLHFIRSRYRLEWCFRVQLRHNSYILLFVNGSPEQMASVCIFFLQSQLGLGLREARVSGTGRNIFHKDNIYQ